MNAPRSLAELFQRTAQLRPDAIALRASDDPDGMTWRAYAERVRRLAGGLASLGVQRGDRVALMLVNRPEMHLVDTAVFHLGATPFSVYNTSSPEQIAFLVASAEPTVVVTESQFLGLWQAGVPGTSVKHVVCVDGDAPGTVTLAGVEAAGDEDFDFETAWRSVGPADLLTLIYTSGTTGDPKGVRITHANMLAELAATNSILKVTPEDRIISFLPSAHIADRWASHYLQIAAGNELTCVSDRAQVMPTVVAVRPTLFGGVPQMWQKVRAAIEGMIAAEPDETRRAGVAAAIDFGRQYVKARDEGETRPELDAKYATLDAAVFSAMRAKLGLDQARIVQSGAAPIPVETVVFFNAIGIPLADVWGMSELSCVAAMAPETGAKFGTIGKAVPGVEIAVADDGELLVRGPQVMDGYLGRPDLTAEVIDAEGWLHTGDIGSIDEEGWIRIVDRKKELIINASGKNMSPANIESAIKAGSALIGQAVVIGNDRPYNVALIVLDPEALAMYAARRGVDPEPAVLAEDTDVHTIVASAVEAGNARLSRVEQIKKFAILPEVWQPGTEVLTHTMKLRRRQIDAAYAAQIEALYA